MSLGAVSKKLATCFPTLLDISVCSQGMLYTLRTEKLLRRRRLPSQIQGASIARWWNLRLQLLEEKGCHKIVQEWEGVFCQLTEYAVFWWQIASFFTRIAIQVLHQLIGFLSDVSHNSGVKTSFVELTVVILAKLDAFDATLVSCLCQGDSSRVEGHFQKLYHN